MFVGMIKKSKDALIGTDHNGKILYSTNTMQYLFGFDENELRGQSILTYSYVFITLDIGKFIVGPAVTAKNVDSPLVYSFSSEGSSRKVRPLGTGTVFIPIVNKAEAPLCVTAEITANTVDGNVIYTWWIFHNSERDAVTEIPNSVPPEIDTQSNHEGSSTLPRNIVPCCDFVGI